MGKGNETFQSLEAQRGLEGQSEKASWKRQARQEDVFLNREKRR